MAPKTPMRAAPFLPFLVVPNGAYAFDFGFVRVPDYLDMPIGIALILTLIFVPIMKAFLPRGKSLMEVDKAERTPAMLISGVLAVISTTALIGLLFLGMGLQRAAEW